MLCCRIKPIGKLSSESSRLVVIIADENWQKHICETRDDGIGFKSVFLSDKVTNGRYPYERISADRVLCSVKVLNGVLDESF